MGIDKRCARCLGRDAEAGDAARPPRALPKAPRPPASLWSSLRLSVPPFHPPFPSPPPPYCTLPPRHRPSSKASRPPSLALHPSPSAPRPPPLALLPSPPSPSSLAFLPAASHPGPPRPVQRSDRAGSHPVDPAPREARLARARPGPGPPPPPPWPCPLKPRLGRFSGGPAATHSESGSPSARAHACNRLRNRRPGGLGLGPAAEPRRPTRMYAATAHKAGQLCQCHLWPGPGRHGRGTGSRAGPGRGH